MEPELLSLDKITRLCPLGVRFWDEVTQQVVANGLTVTASPKIAWEKGLNRLRGSRRAITTFPELPASLQTTARPNRSGVFVFHDLPGLLEVEQGLGDDAFWNSSLANAKHAFVVAVNDTTGRFLPFTFQTQLPCRGVFDLDCDSPLSPADFPMVSALAQVPVFSTPARPVPAGLAALRADLWSLGTAGQASWALLRVTIQDAVRGPLHARALADGRGSLLALFPYPEPNETYPLSPPYGGSALSDQRWDIQLEAFFGDVGSDRPFVDICKALGQASTSPVKLLTTASPLVELSQTRLAYGQEVILKSADSLESKLFLT